MPTGDSSIDRTDDQCAGAVTKVAGETLGAPSLAGRPHPTTVKTAQEWLADDEHRGNNPWNPMIPAASQMAREILRLADDSTPVGTDNP